MRPTLFLLTAYMGMMRMTSYFYFFQRRTRRFPGGNGPTAGTTRQSQAREGRRQTGEEVIELCHLISLPDYGQPVSELFSVHRSTWTVLQRPLSHIGPVRSSFRQVVSSGEVCTVWDCPWISLTQRGGEEKCIGTHVTLIDFGQSLGARFASACWFLHSSIFGSTW